MDSDQPSFYAYSNLVVELAMELDFIFKANNAFQAQRDSLGAVVFQNQCFLYGYGKPKVPSFSWKKNATPVTMNQGQEEMLVNS